MFDKEKCAWLLENADAPIRYRVLRELLGDATAARRIEPELLSNPIVQKWLMNLQPAPPRSRFVDEHGSFDTCLENSLLKAVQLGLHAGVTPVADSMAYYLSKASQLPGKPVRKRTITSIHFLGCNLLACAGFLNGAVLDYMRESLNELYIFVRNGNYDIYCDDEERALLKGIPAVYKDRKIIKSSIVDVHGYCYPLIYDIVGLSSLYALGDQGVNQKIDTVIRYISTDEFHNTVADGYGVLPPYQGKYHTMGWDPKYPGWFDIVKFIECYNNQKILNSDRGSGLLFFAQYISKYPPARKTQWFIDLLSYLEKYRTANGTYIFPKEFLTETTGYAVGGKHMSFGENRRKKNWLEIESTFFMQLLRYND